MAKMDARIMTVTRKRFRKSFLLRIRNLGFIILSVFKDTLSVLKSVQVSDQSKEQSLELNTAFGEYYLMGLYDNKDAIRKTTSNAVTIIKLPGLKKFQRAHPNKIQGKATTDKKAASVGDM